MRRILAPPSSTGRRDDRLYELVGQRVRNIRAERMTQAELAHRVGIGRTSITNLEQGRQKVALHTLLAIADALDVELAELLPTREDLATDARRVVLAPGVDRLPDATDRVIRSLFTEEGQE